MKRIATILFVLLAAAAYGQSNSGVFSAIRSRVADSTTVATPSGYGIIYYNTQSNKFRVYQNGSWGDLSGGGGGASYTFSNGLTNTAGAVKLGGTITGITTLPLNTSTEINFTNGGTSFFKTERTAGDLFRTSGTYINTAAAGDNLVDITDYSQKSTTAYGTGGTQSYIQLDHLGHDFYSESGANYSQLYSSATGGWVFDLGGTGRFAGYAADYSANYTNRSFIDKGYAAATYAPISGGAYWSLASGGTLTGANTIAQGANNLNFTGSGDIAIGTATYTGKFNIITSSQTLADGGFVIVGNGSSLYAYPSISNNFILQASASNFNITNNGASSYINISSGRLMTFTTSQGNLGGFQFTNSGNITSIRNFNISGSVASLSTTAYNLSSQLTSTNITNEVNGIVSVIESRPIINHTGGTGTIIGFHYNPSLTSIVGVTNLAFMASSGSVLLGTTSLGATTTRFEQWGNGTTTGINAVWKDSGGTTKATLLDNGNFGIGTSPTYKLQVKGTAANQNLFVVQEDGGTNLIEAKESGGVNQLGFFAATPVAKPAAVTTPQGIADALTSLGLLSTSTISGGGSYTFSEGLTETLGVVTLGGTVTTNILIQSLSSNYISLSSGDGVSTESFVDVLNTQLEFTSQDTAEPAPVTMIINGSDGITVTDGKTTKTGIQYFASGYETTDLTLTSRGYVLGAKTYAAKQTFFTSAAVTGASINIPHGVAPTSPVDGDFWTTTTSVYARINGGTVDLGGAGGGVSDGDKGDITVSGSGATWTIDNTAVSLAKMADVATGTVFYRKTAATGVPEVQTLATLKTDLGLTGTNSGDQTSIVGITGSLAEFNTALTGADFATGGGTVTGASSGTNTGDQTSIAGISGTTAQFNTALSDGDFATGGGTATGTNTGDQTSIVGITGTVAQFNTAITDGDLATGGGTATGTNTGDQTITNSSDATSHTVTLSSSGGTVQLIEGTNITLTTGGTGAAGTVTIAGTSTGDMVGPASSVDNTIPRFNGTTGKIIQESDYILTDNAGVFQLGSSTTSGSARNINAGGSAADVEMVMVSKGAGDLTFNTGNFNASLIVDGTGYILLGSNVSPNRIQIVTATTSSVLYSATLSATSSGTPTVGFGSGVQFSSEINSSTNFIGSTIESVVTNIGVGTEAADLVFKNMDAGAAVAEKFRIKSTGTLIVATAPANDDALTNILVRDTGTGEIKYRSAASLGGGGGVTFQQVYGTQILNVF